MNTFTRYALALLLTVGVANTGVAVVIDDPSAGAQNGTDVGMIDDFVLSASLDPGLGLTPFSLPDNDPATEDAWVNMVLRDIFLVDTSNLRQVGILTPAAVYTTDTAGIYAADITTAPSTPVDYAPPADYFVVHNSMTNQWGLYANRADRNWAAFDATYLLMDISNFDNLEISQISLYAITEPSVLALIGLGLLGVGFAGSKKKLR